MIAGSPPSNSWRQGLHGTSVDHNLHPAMGARAHSMPDAGDLDGSCGIAKWALAPMPSTWKADDHELMSTFAEHGDERLPGSRAAATNGRAGAQGVPMTAARLAELRAQLELLHGHDRGEIAQRLREARTYGDGSNNDEYHALREEQMVTEARVALLENTVANAIVIDPSQSAAGVAGIGSTITIEDTASGSERRYRLGSAHEPLEHGVISAASPMGRALLGAAPGTIVTVELPGGRYRTVRLLSTETAEDAVRSS